MTYMYRLESGDDVAVRVTRDYKILKKKKEEITTKRKEKTNKLKKKKTAYGFV